MEGTALAERPRIQTTEHRAPRLHGQSASDQCAACSAHFLRQFGDILERETALHGMQASIQRARLATARLMDSPAEYIGGYDRQVRAACKQETMHRIDSTILGIYADIG